MSKCCELVKLCHINRSGFLRHSAKENKPEDYLGRDVLHRRVRSRNQEVAEWQSWM